MARAAPTTTIRRRLYAFARLPASLFSDSRRHRFVADMVAGLTIANHVHLTAVARALDTCGCGNIHAAEKRLSRHLASDCWDAAPLADALLERSAALVNDNTLLVADLTDLAKPYARHLEGLGRVHDGSDPEGRLVAGYCIFEAYVRVGHWQLFPLLLEPLRTYAGAATSENAEILTHVVRIHRAVGGKGTWVLDRGFDRRELFAPLVAAGVAFIVRQRGDRFVQTRDGRVLSVAALAAEQTCPQPQRWPRGGVAVTVEVWLPEVGAEPFLLVVGWRRSPQSEQMLLLVSPRARRAGRTGRWYVRAYRRRWGVEDATRGLKQHFRLEGFLVRTWKALRRLLWLVGWAFWWLNLWGEAGYAELLELVHDHPWRLPKEVTYLFDWIAYTVHLLLHPRPRLRFDTG